MENKKKKMCLAFVRRVVSNLGKENNNFVIIKHYGTFSVTSEDAKNAMISYQDINVFYHHFDNNEMVETYEPFLTIIKNLYLKYYYNETLDEFLGEFDIYQLQKSFFKSYIESGSCVRTESFILDEIAFEKKKMNESVANIIMKLSERHPMLILINNLHRAPKSTISLLYYLIGMQENKNIGIVATYNDLKTVIPCISEIWNNFTTKMNDIGCVFEGGVYHAAEDEDSENFAFESRKIYEYLLKLRAMYYALDLEQADYYLSKIYSKLESERVNADIDCKLQLYRLYAMVSIYRDDIADAQLICNNVRELTEDNPSLEAEYQYNYLLTYAYMYSSKNEKALVSANKCKVLAKKLENEEHIFKAELLGIMVEMSGWHNIYFYISDTHISEEFLDKIQNYGYFNHLAYIYIFAYDNNIDSLKNIETSVNIEDELVRFSEGIDLASNIGNTFLVLKGYKKNIMLCSTKGLFDIAKYYHEKSEIIVGDTDARELADVRNGKGYISTTTHNFKEANDSFIMAIDTYMQMEDIPAVGETLYNMSINCIVDGQSSTAYSYLLVCLRIIEKLRLNDLRVCNIAKIFGLMALCSARLSLEYNCILYLDTCKRFLSDALNGRARDEAAKLDKGFNGNDDELYLYYFVTALSLKLDGKYKKALKNLKEAEVHCYISKGNLFFSLIPLKLEMGLVYEKLGEIELSEQSFKEASDFARKMGYKNDLEMIEKIKNHKEIKYKPADISLGKWTIEDIIEKTDHAAITKQYREMQDNMEFISIWQNILEITDHTKEELVSTAADSLVLNYGLDSFVYIKFHTNDAEVVVNTDNKYFDSENLETLRIYFEKNRASFVTSKMKKNYNDYKKVLVVFGGDSVCSMICNPYYTDEKLDSLFISCIYVKNNWTSQNRNYLMDESELNVFNLLLRQLLIAIARIENINEIRLINNKLRKSSVTDYLTGLKNRDGFYEKTRLLIDAAVQKNLSLELAILYIDLDNFKYYNDTFGHDVGDLILKEISAILIDVAGKEGFATRYGGDEFLITLINCKSDEAMAIAKLTLDTILSKNGYVSQVSSFLGKPVTVPREKSVSCSIGVAVSSDITSDEDLSELIKHADSSLYAIKNTTKNGVKLYVD